MNRILKILVGCEESQAVAKAFRELGHEALLFVARLMNLRIKHIAIENPVGVIGSRIFWYVGGENERERWEVSPRPLLNGGRKPNQTVQPYNFGHDASKRTCLWLTNLPKLKPTEYFKPRVVNSKKRWGNQTDSGQNNLAADPYNKKGQRASLRSKTYTGLAMAMATQWSEYILTHSNQTENTP